MSVIENLSQRGSSTAIELPRLFESFNAGRITKKDLAHSAWNIEEIKAVCSLKLDHNVDDAKSHFYLCGLIDEYLINKFDERILDYGIDHISYALLSNNFSLIERYAKLSHSNYKLMVENGHSTPLYIIQQIILENWDEVARGINIMDSKTIKRNVLLKPDRDFFHGLLNKDNKQIADSIYQLLKDHKKRNKYKPLISEFISTPALGYTKLAWLKGREIEIEHDFIPKELLPINPLKEYKIDYDFLKDKS